MITTVDYHTAGEPFRIVTGGAPDIPGATVLERSEHALTGEADRIRALLCNEPRGHADMYGCFLVPPDDPGAVLLPRHGGRGWVGAARRPQPPAILEHAVGSVVRAEPDVERGVRAFAHSPTPRRERHPVRPRRVPVDQLERLVHRPSGADERLRSFELLRPATEFAVQPTAEELAEHLSDPRDTAGPTAEEILEATGRLLEKMLVFDRLTQDDVEHDAVPRVRHRLHAIPPSFDESG